MSFGQDIKDALFRRRDELDRAGVLRTTTTPIVPAEMLRPWQQESAKRTRTTIHHGTADGVTRIVKTTDDRWSQLSVYEPITLLARSLAISDDARLLDRTHLCLPEAIAFTGEEVLVAYAYLPQTAAQFSDNLRNKQPLLTLAMSAAEGLRALHDAGYAHHDISSANLLLHHAHDPASAMWIDFDLAALLNDDPVYRQLDERGFRLGTPRYAPMAGILFGLGPPMPRARADLVAFGWVLAELIKCWPPAKDKEGPFTFIGRREKLRGSLRRRALGHVGIAGLERIIVTLTDEEAAYDARELSEDLRFVISGNEQQLHARPVHRETWGRRPTPIRRLLRRRFHRDVWIDGVIKKQQDPSRASR